MSSFPQLASVERPVEADPTEEYVSPSFSWWEGVGRHLQDIADGRCGEITHDVLEQMMLDPQVASSVELLVESVIGDGADIRPGAKDSSDDYAAAVEVADAWERSLGRIDARALLWQMTRDAIVHGYKIAEHTWEMVEATDDPDAGRLVLARVAAKPRHSVRFVVDRYWNVVGFYRGYDLEGKPLVISPDKFVWLTLHTKDEDPRGRSLLRAAYAYWYLKSRIPVQYHRFLDLLILPFFLGFTAPGADKRNENQTQTDGTKKPVTAAQAMLDALTKFRSMFVAVFPSEAKVQVEWPKSDGAAFQTSHDVLDQQIVKAILLQDLATREGVHQARASSQTHMQVLDLRVVALKKAVEGVLDRLAYVFTVLNFGESAARRYAPKHNLGDTERRDFAGDLTAAASAFRNGLLCMADIPKMFANLGVELADNWEPIFAQILGQLFKTPTAADPAAQDPATKDPAAADPAKSDPVTGGAA